MIWWLLLLLIANNKEIIVILTGTYSHDAVTHARHTGPVIGAINLPHFSVTGFWYA